MIILQIMIRWKIHLSVLVRYLIVNDIHFFSFWSSINVLWVVLLLPKSIKKELAFRMLGLNFLVYFVSGN